MAPDEKGRKKQNSGPGDKKGHGAEKKPPKEKPKYNMWQNSVYMVRFAFREKEKKILLFCALEVVLATAGSLTGLFITPAALNVLETGGGPGKLVATILFFGILSTLVAAASGYVDRNAMFGKITLRSALVAQLQSKESTTSYTNLQDDKFLKICHKASVGLNSNSASGEAIWGTLTDLAKNTVGLLIYIMLLSSVDPLLIAVILITTLISYFVNKPLSGYGYRHRKETEEYNSHRFVIAQYATGAGMAKDIRLFGMRTWLEEMYDKAVEALKAFRRREENVYIWGSIVDLTMTFVRNGFAYAYLIRMVLEQDLGIPSFLLYFNMVGGLSGWVTSILGGMLTLHRQSLDISVNREGVEYPEQFLFEEGRSLEPMPEGRYEIRLEDVSFRYPKAEKDTLSHINLTLHPGEKLAVVGLNGAGKTTLVKLLCGFLDPTAGRVTLDGEDIRIYDRRDYYKMFSALFQEFSVLAVSVAANVARTEDDIDMERVKACVADAGLAEKVESTACPPASSVTKSWYLTVGKSSSRAAMTPL